MSRTSTVLNIFAKHYSPDITVATQDLSSAMSLSGSVLSYTKFHSIGKFFSCELYSVTFFMPPTRNQLTLDGYSAAY
jgi:hypothetical protein